MPQWREQIDAVPICRLRASPQTNLWNQYKMSLEMIQFTIGEWDDQFMP
jgi:hypothetical protein